MRDRGYILVLSHMRGHTTLFAYLLASHAEIDGHLELHCSYESRADLVSMRPRIERELDAPVRGRWLMDKVLHDGHVVAPAVLARPDVRVIVMARHPAATIASQVRRSRTHANVAQYADPAVAAEYYTRRLATLRSLAPLADERWRYFAAERLVSDARGVLDPIGSWLQLQAPIPNEYRVFPHRRGSGDSSPHIGAGRVLRDDEREQPDTGPIDIPPARLAAAVRAWQDLTEAYTGTRPPEGAPS